MSQVQRLHHDVEWAMRAIRTHRAVLILDLAGRILAVNQCCLGMCGYQRDELIGRPVVMLLDDAEKAPERLRQMLQGGEGREARLHGLAQVAKSGRRFRVDARICRIRDEDGQVCLNVLFLSESDGEQESLRALLPRMLPATGEVIRLPARGLENPWARPLPWAPPAPENCARRCDG
ncbi:PAS domain-containing protein [Paracoccus aminovorans]|uniref:PAS domain-containing protein n=1 Tax=Paracoccus aminovorans TaxID=34004 RepID=UPI0009E7CEAF|nr:PAS domain-containing protein [Paracoccus aminovorans]